ncbi:hypothetical protein ETH_00036805 [Eimeria tenella]|uniref:Uncharacterized protein n=1 Tax=Eimeria tenella TaxID=5802 RepID=U6L191_EIMTE|nr:hypothetical protein ETH_00036805 [Eimeria tenella]CDJ44182.1 hypothetical protein ETH_00036805 [Eimeria tenella]|eukprot:XP_013234931.1 hypothetical protein ETH_00036805 [Eimeria tenella]
MWLPSSPRGPGGPWAPKEGPPGSQNDFVTPVGAPEEAPLRAPEGTGGPLGGPHLQPLPLERGAPLLLLGTQEKQKGRSPLLGSKETGPQTPEQEVKGRGPPRGAPTGAPTEGPPGAPTGAPTGTPKKTQDGVAAVLAAVRRARVKQTLRNKGPKVQG